MNKIYFIFVFCFSALQAQQETTLSCGTEINSKNYKYLNAINRSWAKNSNLIKLKTISTSFVPIQIHVIRKNDGSGGITVDDINEALVLLNNNYENANIHFYQCSNINYIDNDNYFDYEKDQMEQLDGTYSVENVLNIYIANNVSNNGDSICGHAQFPGGLDFVMMKASCMRNGTSLSHEVGHYLNLYHTHETKFGDEAVNGSDCIFSGDLMCDTSADPKLSSSSNISNDGCYYYGTDKDENGDSYSPPIGNIMSYSAKECRYEFSPKQNQKLNWALLNLRTYLTCSSSNLNAFFYYTYEPTCASLKEINFHSGSTGNPSNYTWDFGDGVGSSNIAFPNYTYTKNGIYRVKLTISNSLETKNFSQKIVVGTVNLPYFNDFEQEELSLDQFEINNSMKNQIVAEASAGNNNSFGLIFDGTKTTSTSPKFKTPDQSEAFEELWNRHFKSEIFLCLDAKDFTDLKLKFDKKQFRTSNDSYTNFRITVNGLIQGNNIQVEISNKDDDEFYPIEIDLSAFDGQVFTLGFEGSHKYSKDRNSINGGTATFIDNIQITGTSSSLSVDDLVQNGIKIYPNPGVNQLTLSGLEINLKSVKIYNTLGQDITNSIRIYESKPNERIIDIRNLNPGIYILKINNLITKIIKN